MVELGNPAMILLLGYLLALPGIIMEFMLMKQLWHFGFNLYSLYVFLLATGCVIFGFYLIFRTSNPNISMLENVDPKLLISGIIIASVSLLLLLLLGRESAGLAILLSIFIVFAAILILISTPNIERRDTTPIAMYGIGIIVMALAPIHQAWGIWGPEPTGEFELTLLDWGFIVSGVSISIIAINSVKSKMGVFACWLLGAMLIALITFHEIAAIRSSSSFEIYDQILALEGSVFSVVPLALYFSKERESAKMWGYLLNAKRAMDKKRYERALRDAEKAIDLLSASGLSRKYALPWSIIGDIHFRMGKFNSARTYYEIALSIDQKDPETWSNLGSMLAYKGYSEQALESYRKAAYCAPNDPRIWNNIGITLLFIRRFDNALLAFERALDIDDSFPLAHYNAGMVLLRSGKPSAASKHFQKLIELVPDDYAFRRVYSRAKFILKCFQQTAGWKLMGLDVSELIKTILHNPSRFEERYMVYLENIVQEITLSAFAYDRDNATMSMQKIMSEVKKASKSIQYLRMNSGLTLDQLRFCFAVLILAKRAEFQNVDNEIYLAPKREDSERKWPDIYSIAFRPDPGDRAGSPSIS